MATAKATVALIATAIEGTTLAPTAMASDLELPFEAIAAGATKYQLQAWAGPITTVKDSVPPFQTALAVKVMVHHHLGAAETERQYTQDEMQDFLETVLDPKFWEDIVGVFGVDEGGEPEMALGDVTRTGRVISFIITVQCTVDAT